MNRRKTRQQEEYKLEGNLICRACLATNVKMYNMRTISILNSYLELTGISDVGVYTHICYECVARLQKCEHFRSNCSKAHKMLTEMTNKKKTRNGLKQCLESPLKLSALTIIDLQQSHTDSLIVEIKNENSEPFIIEDKIKNEYDNSQISSDAEDNTLSSMCDFEVVLPCNNDLSKVKEDNLELKVKKKRKIKRTRPKSIDDEPLSNLVKKRKREIVINPKESGKIVTRNKKYTFDPKSFEDFATVITMTAENAKREVELRKESRNYTDCPFKCYLCYRGYEAQKTYTNHMRKHSMDYGEHECEFCRLRFPKRHEYCKHILACHKRKFVCKICPFVCYSSSRANIHISLHKGVKYTCEQCGITFKFSMFCMYPIT